MSRGALIPVAVTVVIAAAFVLLGLAFSDASFYGIAAIVAAVGFGAAMVGVAALLFSLISTVRELTSTIERVTEQTVPILGGVNETVAGVNTELARVDSIVANAQHISGQAEKIADVLHAAIANPLIKAIAFTTGTSVAIKAARKVGD